jgi:hypothetical protein
MGDLIAQAEAVLRAAWETGMTGIPSLIEPAFDNRDDRG